MIFIDHIYFMAKPQPRRPAPAPQAQPKRPAPAPPRREQTRRDSVLRTGDREMLYTRQNFILFGIGLALVLLGLAAMTGGEQTDPNVWHSKEIYSPRRITLAPILMVAGFVVVAIGIFKRPKAAAAPNSLFTENNPPAAE